MNVWFRDGAWRVRGKNVGRQLVGRSSFKTPNMLSMVFSGKGGEYPGGAMDTVKAWIAHNQELFGVEHVVLRVFGETAGWAKQEAGTAMFGSPAQDQGIHDVASYVNLCRTNSRVTELTGLHSAVLKEAFRLSHETGCIWEWCDICTLKHTPGLCKGVCDHVIRQMAEEMRELMTEFPKAAFIVNAVNEWDAHNSIDYEVHDIDLLAQRWYRWVSPDGSKKSLSFEAPGEGWEPEQWPESMIIVDHGGMDIFQYEAGTEAGKFQAGMIHPVRKGNVRHDGDPDGGDRFNGREWYEFPPEMFARLRHDSRGAPIGATESMYLISKSGTEGWYRNPNGYNLDQPLQITFYENALHGGNPNSFDYFIVHDDIGAQSDANWNPRTTWEARLAEMFDGGVGPGPGPGPEPPPVVERILFRYPITMAYQELLQRDPDPSGLLEKNQQMVNGQTEAEMREGIIRSDEFAEKWGKS